jgi:hypothetical protein
MNPFTNIWKHPKTSATGLLISVATVAGILSQQGVTLGKAGGGTVVSLAGALAAAFLGLLARDPGAAPSQPPSGGSSEPPASSSSPQARLGAWMLIALLVPLPWMEGCTGTAVAQDIVNWMPALETAVATVDSTAALLAPADAPVFAAATSGFDAAASLLAAQAKAYLAQPSAGALAALQTQVVTLQQQVNSALLQAVRIVNQASQQHALAALQAVATIVSALLALVQSISTKAQVARMAAQSPLKLAQVEPYLNRRQAARIVAAHYGEPLALAELELAHAETDAAIAGL